MPAGGAGMTPPCQVAVRSQRSATCRASVPGASPTDAGIDRCALQRMGIDSSSARTDIATLQNRLPFVHLIESAGANLLKYRVEHFILAERASTTWHGSPRQGCRDRVVHGSSTLGGDSLHDRPVRCGHHVAGARQGVPGRSAGCSRRPPARSHDEGAGWSRALHSLVSVPAGASGDDDADALRIAAPMCWPGCRAPRELATAHRPGAAPLPRRNCWASCGDLKNRWTCAG